ncbi:cysteine hydrolase family protein [Rhizobium rhizogenes]|uniref:cysteine hydrolase family protein n=1 Tax=Rhizobium rhizogenes TaxID=359 RepID=UPI001F2E0149|nr:cysteine hydrolase family protein [Rhizobium rhizogenes]
MIRELRPVKPLSLTDLERKLTIDLARTAIVVVDMQNDFCHPDGWLAHIGVDVTPARAPITPLQTLLPTLRKEGVPIIWLNWGNRPDRMNLPPAVLHVYNRDGRSIGIGDTLPKRDAEVLQAGSWAAAVVDELAPHTNDISVDKFRMSGFHDTELDSILRNLDIETVLFAGVNADQCVLCTLQDANFRGYDCILLEDCSATTSPQFCMDATIYNVRQCFGFVGSSQEIVTALGNDR